MAIDLLEVDAPAHFASALINGDRSGLSDADEADLDSYLATLERLNPGLGSCVDVSESTWFGRFSFPVSGYLGCDLATYTFHVHKD